MKFNHGASVRIQSICGNHFTSATIAGYWERDKDHLDATGRFVISPRGLVYVVRYATDMGVYNIHESRVFPSLS